VLEGVPATAIDPIRRAFWSTIPLPVPAR